MVKVIISHIYFQAYISYDACICMWNFRSITSCHTKTKEGNFKVMTLLVVGEGIVPHEMDFLPDPS